jgi:hypothetical protein
MRINRALSLSLLLLATIAFIAWDSLVANRTPIEVIQPSRSAERLVPAREESKNTNERRGTLGETGEDLFFTPVARQVVAKTPATNQSTQSASQVRKLESSQPKGSSAAMQTPPTLVPTIVPTLTNSPLAFPYTSFGQYMSQEKRFLLLSKQSSTAVVQVGEVLENTWKLVSLAQNQAAFQHITTGQVSQISVPQLP